MLNTIAITPGKLLEVLPVLFEEKLSVMLWSPPGQGKSSVVKTFCESNNLKLFDIRLTQIEPVDLRGLPWVDEQNNKTRWIPPEFLPTLEELETEGYKGGVIFLDELTSSEQRIMASSYELLLDRRIGNYKVPDNVWCVAAGNSVTDGAIAYDMGKLNLPR